MELVVHNEKNGNIVELTGSGILSELQDFIDLIGNVSYLDADKLILNKENIVSDFFDLKTRFAGEVLQKFSNYNLRLAIVGDFSNIESKSLHDFIRESNRVGRIIFVEKQELAITLLSC